MQIEWYHRKATRASLSGGKPRRKTLDPALARLRLFRGIYPANEVPTSDRRKVHPLRLRHRSSGEDLAKIRGGRGSAPFRSGFGFVLFMIVIAFSIAWDRLVASSIVARFDLAWMAAD